MPQEIDELMLMLRKVADKMELMMASECDVPYDKLVTVRNEALTDLLALQVEYFDRG